LTGKAIFYFVHYVFPPFSLEYEAGDALLYDDKFRHGAHEAGLQASMSWMWSSV